MKEQLDLESRRALVKYRYQRSSETMCEAEVMFREGFYNAAVNRLYYTCYYAVSALLFQKGIRARTHSGVKSMFALHVVAAGKLSEEVASTYFTLFEKRQSCDYDDFVFFTRDTTYELVSQTTVFIAAVGELLRENDI